MLQSGSMLQSRYRIFRRIGGGGMGMVYLAEDTRLAGRKCAIKEMSPAQLPPEDRNWATNAFRQEAQMLANLNHPGLTGVTDFFPEEGNWYLVMDYVPGQALEEMLEDAPEGRLPQGQALNVMRQLCDVLEYLHGQHPPVIFRDLKPSNVILTPEGQVKLIDFGIARFFKPAQSQDTVTLGTPGYAAPEQWGAGGQTDARSDIYGLGVLLLRLATGYDPVPNPFPLPQPRSVMPAISPKIEYLILRATPTDPGARYQGIAEFRHDMDTPSRQLRPQEKTSLLSQSQPVTSVGTQPTVPAPGVYPTPYPSPATPYPPPAPARKRTGLSIGLVGIAGGVFLGLCVAVAVGAVAWPKLTNVFVVQPTTPRPTRPPTPTSTPVPSSMTPTAATPTATSPVTPVPPVATSPPAPATPTPIPLRIVYVYGPVGDTDIYVANADGSGRDCVACRACDEAEPDWSPDGHHIVYQADCGGSYDIWIISSSGGNPIQLTRTSATDEREPDWSPDGSQIAFRASSAGKDRNTDGDLRVMDADGGGVYSLGTQGRSPVWSPDGRWITFMSERSGGWEIYVYNLQSGTTDRLTDCSANCRWPAWSPNGRYVIYHSTTGPGSVTADTIWYVPASGGSPVRLVSGNQAGRPTWSVRGLIAFNSDRGIETVRENGSGRQTLIRSDQNWAPVWSE